MNNYKKVLTEIARVYNEAMNIIHYMHDKYYYEKAQMAPAILDLEKRVQQLATEIDQSVIQVRKLEKQTIK